MTELIDHTLRGSWTPSGGAAAPLPPHAARWLRQRIGLRQTSTPAVPSSLVPVPDSALPATARVALERVLGSEGVLLDAGDRLGRAGGLSYLDLVRRRGGADLAVPDAVLRPADPEQVREVLETCVHEDVAVVPFGGGTSVVGGVTALRGEKSAVVALDLEWLNRLVSVDPVSRVAVLQAGLRGPEAEELLAAHGYTLGHFPQSFERATLGGFAATRSAGQASSGYGRFEDMVEGVRMATPSGEWNLGVAPASAAGPDLRQLALGSEGAFGVISELALRVRTLPAKCRYEGVVLDGWERGADAVRALAQHQVLADVTRLSDSDETEVSLALSGSWKSRGLRALLAARGVRNPCLLVLGWEGDSGREVARRRRETWRMLRRFRPVRLGRAPGDTWRRGRFNGPRQRDALLDIGVCVETLETATRWSALNELRGAVRAALLRSLGGGEHRPVVMCHLSHAYETGASLYFTVLAPRDADDPDGQWWRAKEAAGDAISACASARSGPLGTITHHHALGTDHLPWLEREIGHFSQDVLAAIKDRVDPTGVLNPGKLGSQR